MINDENREAQYALAEKLTKELGDNDFELCSIINAKSGLCPEDCKWCSQSRHYSTTTETYGVISKEKSLIQARYLEKRGIKRFSLVTSGKKLSPKELDLAIENIKAIKAETSIKVCASMGLLKYEDMLRLKEAGAVRYHCNLETSSDYFSSLCTTHSTNDKLETLKAAQKAGLDICCGGIIGMGETAEQRERFAKELSEINSLSIPLNILQAVKGTPLEHQPAISQQEILDTIAMIRIANPKARIRFAAGRSSLSPETIQKAIKLGINSAITGDMLTTIGTNIDDDLKFLK